jgi:hypothetical protein
MSAAPLLLHAIIAAAGCWLAIRERRFLMLRIYLAYVALAALAGIPLLSHTATEAYRLAFFAVDLAHNALLLGLSLQIVAALAPEKWGIAAGVFWLTLVIVGVAHSQPSTATAALLDSSIAAEFGAVGLLLVLVLIPGMQWTRTTALAASGIALVALSSAIPEMHWLDTQSPVQSAIQLADLPGLLLLAFSAGIVGDQKETRLRARAASS